MNADTMGYIGQVSNGLRNVREKAANIDANNLDTPEQKAAIEKLTTALDNANEIVKEILGLA